MSARPAELEIGRLRGDVAPRPVGPGGSIPRRLQKMGAVTVGVSLPRNWVGERGLSAGRPIFVRALPDGSLILRDRNPVRDTKSASLRVEPEQPPEHLFRRLIGAYLAGAVEFAVHQSGGLSPETRTIVRTFSRSLGHIESAFEGEGTCILRDVSMGAGPTVPRLLHRMFQLVYDLHRDAGGSWTRTGVQPQTSLSARDDDVDRHAWMIERALRLEFSEIPSGAPPAPGTGDAFRFLLWARDLERIGDHAVLIAEHGVRLDDASPPDPLRRMLSTYHSQALSHLSQANEVAESPNAARANRVLDLGEALHETQRSLADRILMRDSIDRLPPVAIRSLGLILQSIDRTTAYAQNLAEIGLDRDLDRLTQSRAPFVMGAPAPSVSSIGPARGGNRTA